MSIPNVVYSKKMFLLSIQGMVTVHFMDGQTLGGEFLTQDELHIFLKVDQEPMMIPRSQIRFIKGKPGQAVGTDTIPVPDRQAENSLLTTEQKKLHSLDTVAMEMADFLTIQARDQASKAIAEPAPQVLEEEKSEEEGTVIFDMVPDKGTELNDDQRKSLWEDDTHKSVSEEDEEEENEGTVVWGIMELPTAEVPSLVPGKVEVDTPDDDNDSGETVILGKNEEESEKGEPTYVVKTTQVKAKLVCTAGPYMGQLFNLDDDEIIIGRASTNGVALTLDKETSRRHAVIQREMDGYSIEDQNSLNGTYLNDEQITQKCYLKNGDIILVGVSSLEYQELGIRN